MSQPLRSKVSATFSAKALKESDFGNRGNENRTEAFEQILRKKNEIILHLNYQGKIDEKIIENINQIYNLLDMLYVLVEYIESEDEDKEIEFLKNKIGSKTELIDKIQSGDTLVSSFGKVELAYNVKQIYLELNSLIADKQNELLKFTQVYCKIEWNRIKKEANGMTWSGFKFWHDLTADEMLMKNKYTHIDNSYDKLNDFVQNLKIEDLKIEINFRKK